MLDDARDERVDARRRLVEAAEAVPSPERDRIVSACVTKRLEPPPGDTSTMTPGQLHQWCTAAVTRCELVYQATTDPALKRHVLTARQCYWHCATLLQLSLERTHAALFLVPWQEMMRRLDAPTACAIDFVQGAIKMGNAITEHDRLRAGAMLRPAHGRLARLGLIPTDAPLVAP